MDHSQCHVVYFDERAVFDRWVKKDGTASSVANPPATTSSYFDINAGEPDDLQANILIIRAVFNQVYVCNTSGAFISKVSELQQSVGLDCTPILGLITADHTEFSKPHIARSGFSNYSRDAMSPSPTSFRRALTREFSSSPEPEELHGLRLIARVHSDIESESGPKVTIPVAVLRFDTSESTPTASHGPGPFHTSVRDESGQFSLPSDQMPSTKIEPHTMRKCLDAGAIDVLPSPLDESRVFGLTSHAYRVHKDAHKAQSAIMARTRNRKRSWVGVNEEKPYAYLRESMVSKLMAGICNPDEDELTFHVQEIPSIEDSRDEEVASVIGRWDFCAHDYTEDELVHAGSLMLHHALTMPELEKWAIGFVELKKFLSASRNAYNSFVLYHNFKHAIDVLQSTFYFLLQLGTLPPYPAGSTPHTPKTSETPLANLLEPIDSLTLLISAIGHDVGHPGVNNMFLVKLNAPLAQLYNDTSVLEAFHCAAFSQILRRFWPAAFEDKTIRKMMISNILATDMGIHFKYMTDCGHLQEKVHENKGTDGWSPQLCETYRALLCGLLIKCADISNVTRPWQVAERWTNILQLEFANQGKMEEEVGMETALFGGPPELGNTLKLANGQIGFMNTFAYPLFDSVTDLLPRMGFTVQEISTNRSIWSMRVDQQKKKQALIRTDTTFSEGWVSPRSQSPVRRGHSQTDGADDEYFPPQTKTPSRWVPEQPPDSRRSSIASASHLVPGGTGTPKDQSRRSSLQSPFGLPLISSTPEMTSRRSSGAFPGANLAPPPLQARRSSNTVPSSQLQLNDGAGGALAQNGQYSSGAGGENESTPRSSNADRDVFAAVVLTNPGRSGVASAPDLMTEESNRRTPESRRFGHQPQFQNCSTGRISLPSSSSHTRDSQATSGTRALSSVMTPVSPSTQATSFLTVDSDDKSFQNMGVDSRPHSASMPVIFDPDGGDFRSERGRIAAEKNGVRASVLGNGAIGEPGRSVPRRRSRLKLAFWRKKPSSESTP